MVHTPSIVLVRRSEEILWDLVLSFHHLCSRDDSFRMNKVCVCVCECVVCVFVCVSVLLYIYVCVLYICTHITCIYTCV